ncbi:MAG: DUF1284 domain-containing protein [candidate division WS1 bacterium]|jgi:hypothetical protein|nr:DUF1284 domain-containing protein [candidate division WS1 bacterium]
MEIRGHHLVCTYCFYGSGKATAAEFFGVDNAIPRLLEMLQQDPNMMVKVVTNLDDVCEVCPLRRPDGCGRCEDARGQNDKLRGWDRTILRALHLQEGDEIQALELEARIREHIPDISVHCTNCTSASPSGWAEYRRAIQTGLWPHRG